MSLDQDLAGNTDHVIDALVICDERDYETEKVVLQQLIEIEDLTFCYVYDQKDPNLSLCRSVDQIRKKSHCIIFYISEHFCENENLIYVTECLAKPDVEENLINLIASERIKIYDFIWLAKFPIIYQTSDNWQSKLLKQMKPKCYPLFCKLILPESVSDVLHQNGLSLPRLKWDVHGIMVQMGEQVLRVDLDIFSSHIKVHQSLKTSEVCSECSQLCTGDSSVIIMLNEKKEDFSSMVEKCKNEFVKLCSTVLDVIESYNNKTIWTLGCTVQGKPIDDAHVFKKLYNAVHYGLAEKGLRFINKIFHREYLNETSRLTSFEGKWPCGKLPTAVQLANAGFFFSKSPQETRCFHCGVCIPAWHKDDEPWLKHASVCPFCPYIKSKLSIMKIEEAKQLAELERTVPSDIYASNEARIKSFKTFDTRHLKDFETCGKDRDTLIEEFAEAGFHFNGSVDFVECFCCGFSLSSINPEDDLSLTHARLYPKCNHILELLGKKTVQFVLRTAKMEAKEKKTEIAFMMRTLDKDPRRDWPCNIFQPM